LNNEGDNLFNPAASAAEPKSSSTKSDAEKKRLDLERLVGNDVFRHEKLVDIVEDVWLRVPERKLAAYTSEQWLRDVSERCRVTIEKATEKLREGNPEERLFIMKARLLRKGIAQQIIRAMGEVSDKYSNTKTKPVSEVSSEATTEYASRPPLPWEEK